MYMCTSTIHAIHVHDERLGNTCTLYMRKGLGVFYMYVFSHSAANRPTT